jgi:hypothetical protein
MGREADAKRRSIANTTSPPYRSPPIQPLAWFKGHLKQNLGESLRQFPLLRICRLFGLAG